MPIIDGVRKSARLLIVDQDERLLLLYVENSRPWNDLRPDVLNYWMSPGGGLEDGEDWEEAARREIFEELGVTEVELGPVVAVRDLPLRVHGMEWVARERYFLVRTETFVIEPQAEEDLGVRHRWWTIPELAATNELIFPRDIDQLLQRILRNGIPSEPVILLPE